MNYKVSKRDSINKVIVHFRYIQVDKEAQGEDLEVILWGLVNLIEVTLIEGILKGAILIGEIQKGTIPTEEILTRVVPAQEA